MIAEEETVAGARIATSLAQAERALSNLPAGTGVLSREAGRIDKGV